MRLVTADQFFERYFDEASRPSEATRRRWLQGRKIPAKKVGGTWFVDEHAWLADGDPLVEMVLEGR